MFYYEIIIFSIYMLYLCTHTHKKKVSKFPWRNSFEKLDSVKSGEGNQTAKSSLSH